MTFSAICGLIAAVIFGIASALYIIDVARAKVLPSIATFIIISFINVSQLISLILKGVWGVVPFTLVGVVTTLAIVFITLRRRKFYFELPDKIGLAGASVGVIAWILTKDPAWNIYILTLVNFITFTPLIIKSFKHPKLETALPWQLNLLASFFLVLGINSTAAVVWLIPFRQFSCSLILNIGLLRGQIRSYKPAVEKTID